MSKQTRTFIKGTIGNAVFYKLKGQHIARSKPAQVKQTANMKQRSRNFGTAARLGKTLRLALEPLLPFPKNTGMQRNFSGALAKWLGTQQLSDLLPQSSIPALHGFSFNDATGFTERFRPAIALSLETAGQVVMEIPSFTPATAIAAPAHTSHVTLTIIVAACRLADAALIAGETYSRHMPYDDAGLAAQELYYNIPPEPGTLVLAAASLRFWRAVDQKEIREAFMPASVLQAAYW